MAKAISTQLTPANIAGVLDILAETPARLAQAAATLGTANPRYPLGEGRRSFAEELAHLINCEGVTAQAIYLALLMDSPLLPDLHAERDWGHLLRPDLLDLPDLLAYFQIRRRLLLRVLHSQTPAQWSRPTREPGKQRQESVYWRARSLALHEREHLTDLEARLTNPIP